MIDHLNGILLYKLLIDTKIEFDHLALLLLVFAECWAENVSYTAPLQGN